MRFAVLKGVQGFGDRLQCLLQAIRYALHTDRILVIDWRDSDWTHDPDQYGFEDFLQITGVKTYGLQEFIHYVTAYKDEITVAPRTWTHKLTDHRYPDWIYYGIFSHDKGVNYQHPNGVISDIIAWNLPDFDEDIVVLPGVYQRVYRYQDTSMIKLSRWAESYLLSQFKQADIFCRYGYDVVHLRGGTKPWAGGYVSMKSLADQIEKTWPDEENYFQRMHLAYENMVKQMEPLPLLLVSDSERLSKSWQQRFGACLTVPTFNSILEESGTHKLTPQQLQQHAISKVDLNMELLRDFILLTNARTITWDGISLFSKAAVGCKGAEISLLWLPEKPAAPNQSEAEASMSATPV